MNKVYLKGLKMEEGVSNLLKENNLTPVEEPSEAEVVIYSGSIDDLLETHAGILKARFIVPSSMFLMNKSISPIDLSDQTILGERVFSEEDIRGVSEKIGELVDSLDSDEHFSDLARYMKINAIELVQNALIHKRMAGKEGEVNLSVFETAMFYNICVTDPFGALEKDDVLAKLGRVSSEKTYEMKESGAGLGLYMLLKGSDCMIFRLKSQKETQVCCIINKYKRLKQFKSKSPALYIFKE